MSHKAREGRAAQQAPPPPAITQSGGDAACTGEANVSKLGRGREDRNCWKVFC